MEIPGNFHDRYPLPNAEHPGNQREQRQNPLPWQHADPFPQFHVPSNPQMMEHPFQPNMPMDMGPNRFHDVVPEMRNNPTPRQTPFPWQPANRFQQFHVPGNHHTIENPSHPIMPIDMETDRVYGGVSETRNGAQRQSPMSWPADQTQIWPVPGNHQMMEWCEPNTRINMGWNRVAGENPQRQNPLPWHSAHPYFGPRNHQMTTRTSFSNAHARYPGEEWPSPNAAIPPFFMPPQANELHPSPSRQFIPPPPSYHSLQPHHRSPPPPYDAPSHVVHRNQRNLPYSGRNTPRRRGRRQPTRESTSSQPRRSMVSPAHMMPLLPSPPATPTQTSRLGY